VYPFGPGHLPSYPGYGIRYPGAWIAAGIATTAWWSGVAWSSAGAYCGCAVQPYTYVYGDNITYDDGTVYYGNQPVATAEQYYQQATQMAADGQQIANEDWMPLGVFGVVRQATDRVERVAQIAVNKEGIIRGNFQDLLTDTVTPIVGSVDKQNQRVAMKLQGNDTVVVETGLYNLTQDEVPVLIHFSPDRQEPRTMVRLKQPEEQAQQPQ
jgi:hypothetical protein